MNTLKTNNLLFIQGGSRWKFDEKGNVYTDSNFNEKIWDRYRSYCGELTVILRREEKVYSEEEVKSRFNRFDVTKSKYISLPDLYRPVKNCFDLAIRRTICLAIKEQVKKADKVIIRSLGNIYTNTALKYCRKYNKPYLVEVTGFAFEGLWYHSLRGKIVAPFKELQYRKRMKNVPYAVYVTQEALQKRYPCNGKTLGCSDVELLQWNDEILRKRLDKIENQNKIIIGTAAFLDVRFKGQEYVIRALAELKKRGIQQIEYQMIGAGQGKRLLKLAERLGVSSQIKIVGAIPHDQVFAWLDQIDFYVHPSFIEGLCRSVVEAMSRACPVICSDVGGNYELASDKCLFRKGDYRQLANILMMLIEKKNQCLEAERSFRQAKSFEKELLDQKREAFYRSFAEN